MFPNRTKYVPLPYRLVKSGVELDLSFKQIDAEQAKQLAKELPLETNKILTRLVLGGNCIGDDGAVAITTALQRTISLEHLDLGYNSIGDVGMTAIAQTMTQKELYLSGNEISAVVLTSLADSLKKITRLTDLWLDSCSIDDEGAAILASALKSNTTLARLNLGHNKIGNVGAKAILDALTEYNTTLTQLDLDGNDDISPTLLSSIASMVAANESSTRPVVCQPDSTIGSFQDNPPPCSVPTSAASKREPEPTVDRNETASKASESVPTSSSTRERNQAKLPEEITTITPPRQVRYIRDEAKLLLTDKFIDYTQAKQIAEELASNTTLKCLDLSCSNIGDSGASVIAASLQTNESLTALYLERNGIRGVGMAALSQALKQNVSLLELSIGWNTMATGSMASLANALKVNKGLTKLVLNRCSIHDKGVAILADSLKTNTTLSSLDLRSNMIGDIGAMAIYDALLEYNTSLTNLSLGDNGISSSILSTIEHKVAINAGTRGNCRPLASGSSPPIQSDWANASIQEHSRQDAKSPTLKVASKADPCAQPPPAPVTCPGMELASLDCLSDGHEGPVSWPKQRAELEIEIRRLTAVRDACLATADKNQWQHGIAAENAILQMQTEIASGRYPTPRELQSMVDNDSLAAAVPLRDRLEQLQIDLAMEREAEERMRRENSKNAETDLIGVGRRAVLAALHSTEIGSIAVGRRAVSAALRSTDPSDTTGPVPIEYLVSITSHWTDVISSGGFGVVFKGQDATSGIVVAIKKIPNDRLHENEKMQFKNEIEVRAHMIGI
jgi:Ran GTPase-activating protein (RanGAP) involved in mRNA processing and transport